MAHRHHAPFLFLIVLNEVLTQALANEKGLIIRKAFRTPDQRAHEKEITVSDLDYADDILLASNAVAEAQRILPKVANAAKHEKEWGSLSTSRRPSTFATTSQQRRRYTLTGKPSLKSANTDILVSGQTLTKTSTSELAKRGQNTQNTQRYGTQHP